MRNAGLGDMGRLAAKLTAAHGRLRQGMDAWLTVDRKQRHVVRCLPSAAEQEAHRKELLRLQALVFLRDDHHCAFCGGNQRLTCEYIVAPQFGGKTVLDNLATACWACRLPDGPSQWIGWRVYA